MSLFGPNINKLKSRGDIRGLIDALSDWDPFIRGTAAKALGEIGDPVATEPLINLLGDKESGVRSSASKALAKIGTPAINSLVKLLGNNNEEIRENAEETLIKIGKPAIKPLIVAMRNPNNSIQQEAAITLVGVGLRALENILGSDKLKELIEGKKTDAPLELLAKLCDEDDVDSLIETTSVSSDVAKGTAALLLGKIGNKESIKPLINLLNDENEKVRTKSAIALYDIKVAEKTIIETLGEYEAAEKYFLRLAELRVKSNDYLGAAFMYEDTAQLYYDVDNLMKATSCLEEAIACHSIDIENMEKLEEGEAYKAERLEKGEGYRAAALYCQIPAYLCETLGQLDKKTQFLERGINNGLRALEIFEQEKNYNDMCFCYNSIGTCFEGLNRLNDAAEYYLRGAEILEKEGNYSRAVARFTAIGRIYENLGRIGEAMICWKRGIQNGLNAIEKHERETPKDKKTEATVEKEKITLEEEERKLKEDSPYRWLAECYEKLGQTDEAKKYYGEWTLNFEKLTEPTERILLLDALHCYEKLDEYNKAKDVLGKIKCGVEKEIAGRKGYSVWTNAYTNKINGKIALRDGNLEDSLKCLEEALALFDDYQKYSYTKDTGIYKRIAKEDITEIKDLLSKIKEAK